MRKFSLQNIQPGFFRIFLFKLLLFLAVVVAGDYALGSLLKKYYFSQQSGFDAQTTYAIEKTEAQTLIFGSSRAKNNFDPETFEKCLHQSCYNAGRYGYPIFYHYAVLKSVLKRYKPKLVILNVDAGMFSKNQESYDLLYTLSPYYKSHPELRAIAALRNPYEKLKQFSFTYPYNSLILPIIAGNIGLNKERFDKIKGFVPLNEVIGPPPYLLFDYTKEKELDSLKINYYKLFIQDCIAAKIKLIVICPPYEIDAIGTDKSITESKKIAADFSIPYFDYSRDTFYTKRPQLYADYKHLNGTGAEIFDSAVLIKITGLK